MHNILREKPDIWRIFTCEEEYESSIKDKYDRFPHYISGNREPFEPKASQYLLERGYRLGYPEEEPFAVCLTHDIDSVYRSTLSKGLATLRCLRTGDVGQAISTAKQMKSKKYPSCNFRDIIALEKKYGAQSSFFFLAASPEDQNVTYNIRDLDSEIGMICDAGWEVGLHGGHKAYCDPAILNAEKQRLERVLGRPVVGYRNHFLRFRVPETWEYLSRAGFLYDTTFGYADCAGFRNGMCHPFKPYNLQTSHQIDILEIPLAIMDCSLDQYMRLDVGKAWKVCRHLIDVTERCHGVITILWHNTYMEGDWLKIYEKMLRYCRDKKAWMTSGQEIEKLMGQ